VESGVVGRRWSRPPGSVAVLGLLALLAFGVPRVVRADEMRRIDLNSASESELASLPGIGPAKAQAIIAHRSTTPFSSPEDLRQVKGIGDHLYESLKDRISVGGKTVAGSSHGGQASGSSPDAGAARAQHRAEGTTARESAR